MSSLSSPCRRRRVVVVVIVSSSCRLSHCRVVVVVDVKQLLKVMTNSPDGAILARSSQLHSIPVVVKLLVSRDLDDL